LKRGSGDWLSSGHFRGRANTVGGTDCNEAYLGGSAHPRRTWPSTPPLDPPLSPFVNWFTPERIESHVLAFMGLMMLILGWAARVRLKELEPVEKQEADTLDEEATASSSSRG